MAALGLKNSDFRTLLKTQNFKIPVNDRISEGNKRYKNFEIAPHNRKTTHCEERAISPGLDSVHFVTVLFFSLSPPMYICFCCISSSQSGHVV